MAKLMVALNPSLDEYVRQLAAEEQKPMAVIIRDALREYKLSRELQELKVAGLKAVINE